ncbi:hypothetical protein QIS74_04056 [Colletotrichum tabaci]|uniref:Zn(2)-C6 fungal-type domain-containing protein n=1 Tax=Colletotrichum tabaci TaxID=1209068 RepID=A0AAV9TK36_9PEZI
MSNRVPSTIALPTFDRPQANTNTGSSSSQQQPAQLQQPQQQQQTQQRQTQYYGFYGEQPEHGAWPLIGHNTQQNQPQMSPEGQQAGLSAVPNTNPLLPDQSQTAQQFPTTEHFTPANSVLPQGNAYTAPPPRTRTQPAPDPSPRKCDNCRKTRAFCSGHEPCNHCVVAGITCSYNMVPLRASPPKHRRSSDDEDANDTDQRQKRPRRILPAPLRDNPNPPLHRRRPQLGVPGDGLCDWCREGGHQDKPCDADHANEIECSQCTKYRNLTNPDHVCTVRGGEYWQKRFANSRPTYSHFDLEASCCVRCREKRGSNRPTLCDIDDRVKIGCTPCKIDGVLCEIYNEERVLALVRQPPPAAALMWDRPEPRDGVIAADRRPWWRHMCRECYSQIGERRWKPCSWILDVRLGEYKCGRCDANGLACVDSWTGVQYDAPYTYSGSGDKVTTLNKSGPRTGRHKCTNCAANDVHCRGYNNDDAGFACAKCSIWGLTCQIRPPDGPTRTLPHMDRRMIGYSRVSSDRATNFLGCQPCLENGDRCDRKRPCDSCHDKRRACDLWSSGTCKRSRTVGADTPDYYMSLGYGPDGVNSGRWHVPEDQLIGPNKPKRAEASAAFSTAAYAAAQTPSRPGEAPNVASGVGNRYNAFFNNLSPPNASSSGSTVSALASSSSNNPANQTYYGDNNAAQEALQTGQGYETWVGNFNAQRGGRQQTPGNENFPPFGGPPQNRDELGRIMGGGGGGSGGGSSSGQDTTSDSDFYRMAQGSEVVVDPALSMDVDETDVQEQNRVAADIRQAMHLYVRDMRFIPVELRQFSIPEIMDVPANVRPVRAPQRVLLELEDHPQAQLRPPYQTQWDPPAYEKNLRELLCKWKRPGYNVLCDIPDEPANFDAASAAEYQETRCEESQPQCGAVVRNGAHCENVQHMVRPQPYAVCDGCDMKGKKNLFEGPSPLTRGEFLNMRAYACSVCAVTEEAGAEFGGSWSGAGAGAGAANPVTGCLCAAKLLSRRLCQFHRYRLAAAMMVQAMFVAEWVVTNFGPDACLFCKERPSRLTTDGFADALVYLCLNCQGVVCESFERGLHPGVHEWFGGVEPATLWEQNWDPMPGVVVEEVLE